MDVVTNLGANLLKFAEIYGVQGYFFAEGQIVAWYFDGYGKGAVVLKKGDYSCNFGFFSKTNQMLNCNLNT
jgi:hypothetical protein